MERLNRMRILANVWNVKSRKSSASKLELKKLLKQSIIAILIVPCFCFFIDAGGSAESLNRLNVMQLPGAILVILQIMIFWKLISILSAV